VRAVRGARLVLAGDTGAVHLARALGRPLLAVHGPTDPVRHGPWNDPAAVIFHRLECSFCHQRMSETKACLLDILPAEIVERARARLAFSAV
jgi:ADP-heptose:LPS heptosyltransferase